MPYINLDREGLRLTFVNVLVNSTKFTIFRAILYVASVAENWLP